MSSRPEAAAPPRVAIQSASSAVIQRDVVGPRRWASRAWRRLGEHVRAVVAGRAVARPGRPATPASSSARTGAMPEPRRKFDDGQCATPVPVSPNSATSSAYRCTQCASQTSGPSQPHAPQVLDRAGTPYISEAVRLLVHRLRQVRVQAHAVLAGQLGGAAHEVVGHGEGRAGRERDAGHAPAAGGSWYSRMSAARVARGSSSSSCTTSSGGRPPWLFRGSWTRAWDGSGCPGRARRAISTSMSRSWPAREEVQVIGGGGAAGEQQLAQADARRRAPPRPRRRRARPRASSVSQRKSGASCTQGTLRVRVCGQVVVRVDEAGQDDLAAGVERRSTAPAGALRDPTAAIRSSSIRTHPPGRRRRACRPWWRPDGHRG